MKKVFILIGVSMMLCCMCSCNKQNKIDYNLSYNQKGGFGSKEIEGKTHWYNNGMITSLEELKNECIEWNNDAYNENSDSYSSDLSKKIRSYDENYFKENNLIIVKFETGNYLKTKIKNIVVDESTLVVNLKQTKKLGSGISTTEAYDWLMLIEIKKNDVINVNELKVNCYRKE